MTASIPAAIDGYFWPQSCAAGGGAPGGMFAGLGGIVEGGTACGAGMYMPGGTADGTGVYAGGTGVYDAGGTGVYDAGCIAGILIVVWWFSCS